MITTMNSTLKQELPFMGKMVLSQSIDIPVSETKIVPESRYVYKVYRKLDGSLIGTVHYNVVGCVWIFNRNA